MSHNRDKERKSLAAVIRQIFADREKRYGACRIYRELLRRGFRVAYKRVHAIMWSLGLLSVHQPARKKTTIPSPDVASVTDLVQRDFTADESNQVWYGDITYVRTWDGWAYVASVIDAFSKKIAGWCVDTHMRTDLVIRALDRALQARKPRECVVFHADRGCQYTSAEFGEFCQMNNVIQPWGHIGECYDKAASESFWVTLKKN